MSKTVQFKRGNANVSSTYVGAQGEITVNTDNYTLNVHDGVTAGGYTILNTNVSNIGNLVVTNQTITGTSPSTNITLSPNAANVVLTSNLVTPNIAINRYTIQSVNAGSSLTLPAETDGANVDLTNTYSNIRFTTYDPTTNAPYTLVLNTDSDVVFPGYIKSNLGGAEIQFAGGQGLLMYANFATGSTGISLNDTGTTDIFANADIRLTTNYAGASKQWLFASNGTLTTTGNLSTANLSISHAVANNTVQVRTLANSDLKISATDGTYQSAIYLWANNQRMSFNTVSNAFDFNFNGQLSATDFTASKNSAYGYSFYAAGGGYSGMRHTSGPPDFISIEHEGNIFAKFVANGTTDIFGNLVVSSDGQTFGSFPDAFVQVYSNVDTYSQAVFQNLSNGTAASTDVVITADNGNDSSYYVDLGITSSQHADAEFFGDTTAINDAYLYVTSYDQVGPSVGNVGNLIIGSTNGNIKLFVGNTAEANVVATISESLITVSGNIIPSANITYALGSETNQWRDLWVSNNTIYIGGIPLTIDSSGNLEVNGNPISGGAQTVTTSNTAPLLSNGSLWFNTVDGRTYIKYDGQWIDSSPAVIPLQDPNIVLSTITWEDGSTQQDAHSLRNGPHTLELAANGNLVFPDNTIQSTAFVGTGDISFANSSILTPINVSQDWPNGVISLRPGGANVNYASAGQYINIYPTGLYDAPHIHVAAGTENGGGDLILGSDAHHVDVNHNGNVYIRTDGQNNVWNFSNTGSIIFPDESEQVVAYSEKNSFIEWTANAQTITLDTPTFIGQKYSLTFKFSYYQGGGITLFVPLMPGADQAVFVGGIILTTPAGPDQDVVFTDQYSFDPNTLSGVIKVIYTGIVNVEGTNYAIYQLDGSTLLVYAG